MHNCIALWRTDSSRQLCAKDVKIHLSTVQLYRKDDKWLIAMVTRVLRFHSPNGFC